MNRACLSSYYRRSSVLLALLLAFSLLMVMPAYAQFTLVKISGDSFTNPESQHKTEVEPDTYSWGSTMMAAFQVARISGGGGADLGFAITTDGGKTWTHGLLPGLTVHYKQGTHEAASDASVVYNARFGVWLISSLPINPFGVNVATSISKDGIHWSDPVMVDNGAADDKNWITCDNNTKSPFYGNCYTEWDASGLVLMSTSTDGGKTWGPAKPSADNSAGLGGEPLVQPNGHVVVPFAGNGLQVFSSTDGGVSWGTRTTIAPFNVFGDNSGLRSSGLPLPSTGIDKSGKLYVVWSDCSFRAHCSTNDLVMSTSTDGTKWTAPTRIPIDPLTSKVNHLIPGLGVDRSTSGKTAHLTSTYYYFPDAGCTGNACLLSVGFTTSSDGGKTWTRGKQLAGPMQLTWLPSTFSGRMVADYLSSSYVNGQPFGVFMVAMAPQNGVFNQAAYTTKEPLLAAASEPRFSSKGEKQISRATSPIPEFHDVEVGPPAAPPSTSK
jgi:hypothetical protein